MDTKQLYDFWGRKYTTNLEVYKQLLIDQKTLLNNLNRAGYSTDVVEEYISLFFKD